MKKLLATAWESIGDFWFHFSWSIIHKVDHWWNRFVNIRIPILIFMGFIYPSFWALVSLYAISIATAPFFIWFHILFYLGHTGFLMFNIHFKFFSDNEIFN